MPALKRFWQSLETLIGGATVAEEWNRLTGDQYELARQFLRPSGELASFFPHPDPGVCLYRVVTHAPGDHVAICDETGQWVALKTEDLVLYELDRLALRRAIVKAFGWVAEGLQDTRDATPWRVGQFAPLAGYRFPVFLTIPRARHDLVEATCRLAATQDGPFILLAPTRRFLTEDSEDLLRRQGACFLALDEATSIGQEGRLVVSPAGQTAIEQFRRRVVPEPDGTTPLAFFSTPAGASWSQLKMRFVDGHTVSVAVGGAHGVFHFAEMGMANRKNGTPTVQWELLRQFTAGYGILTWRSAGADRKNKKRRENLARNLQAFFRIDGDPFTPYGNGWQARFQVEPDG
jgi:hypothetical protein